MVRVSIEGNIGSGKTEVIHGITQYVVYEENVAGWEHWLEKVTDSPKRWAFTSQLKILLDMTAIPDYSIVERSPYTVRYIFTQDMYDRQLMTNAEYQLYLEFYDIHGWKPDVIVYIDTPPAVCLQRILRRNRPSERNQPNTSIPRLQYLEGLHRSLFAGSGIPVYIVNGDRPLPQVIDDVNQILSETALSPPSDEGCG